MKVVGGMYLWTVIAVLFVRFATRHVHDDRASAATLHRRAPSSPPVPLPAPPPITVEATTDLQKSPDTSPALGASAPITRCRRCHRGGRGADDDRRSSIVVVPVPRAKATGGSPLRCDGRRVGVGELASAPRSTAAVAAAAISWGAHRALDRTTDDPLLLSLARGTFSLGDEPRPLK